MSARGPAGAATGLVAAGAIIALWASSLIWLLSTPISHWPLALVPVAMLGQMFLYTGLFITAHDAMHGQVAPGRRRLNHAIGVLAVALYALFSYRKLFTKHWQHHRHPCTATDPDFHDGDHANFVAWYIRFFAGYSSVWQIGGMAAVANVLTRLFHVADANLWLFWALPAIASSVQLFYFGTYRPHREPTGGYQRPHCATSNDFSPLWSFLSCYHFGYHEEHHRHPAVAWWRLPALRGDRRDASR